MKLETIEQTGPTQQEIEMESHITEQPRTSGIVRSSTLYQMLLRKYN